MKCCMAGFRRGLLPYGQSGTGLSCDVGCEKGSMMTPEIVVQFRAPPPTADVYGLYVRARLAAQRRIGYHPFDDGCWDVPPWAVPVLQRLAQPDLRLLYPTEFPTSIEPPATIYGSVLVANRPTWVAFVQQNPSCQFKLGGYTQPVVAPNVRWYDALEQALAELGPVRNEYWPRRGVKANGVRVALSKGCQHGCRFCTVPGKGAAPTPLPWWEQPLPNPPVGIVYIDDKTFGQAANWRELAGVRKRLWPDGFVVQTTALHITQHPSVLTDWAELGVIAVEIGVESFNDTVLKRYRKPARIHLIHDAVARVADAGMYVCPNIMVGLEGETDATYDNTAWFMCGVPRLGYFNMFCLGDYSVTGVGDETQPTRPTQTVDERRVALAGYALLMRIATERMDTNEQEGR